MHCSNFLKNISKKKSVITSFLYIVPVTFTSQLESECNESDGVYRKKVVQVVFMHGNIYCWDG